MLKKRLDRNEFDFIGVKSFDLKDREEILDRYDNYQMKKLEFLNLYYPNPNTRLAYFQNYMNNFHDYEIEKEKDLAFFSSDEIANVVKSCVWVLEGQKEAILTFAKMYCSWCKNVLNEIPMNPCELVVKNVVIKSSKVLLNKKILPLNIFYEQLTQMELAEVTMENIIVILLCRYGISGDHFNILRTLKWHQIDRVNMCINIENDNGEVASRVPIDEKFLFWLDKIEHTDTDIYIVNKRGSGSGKPLEYQSIYTRIRPTFNAIVAPQFGYKDLLFSRQIELLLQLRKHRQLTTDDFKNIIDKFYGTSNYSYSKVSGLVNKYESLTKDKVLTFVPVGGNFRRSDDIIRENPEKVVVDIVKDLELNIDNTNDLDIETIISEGVLIDEERKNEGINATNRELETTREQSEQNEDAQIINNFVDKEDSSYQDEVNKIFEDDDILNHQYGEKEKKQKSENEIKKGTYIRDPRVGKLALKLANYQCELDETHETFISNTTSENYVEAHHLIPMKYYDYDEFKVSIDNEANIVALCPTCHRLLHYGEFQDKEEILRTLYDANIDNLNKAGIQITIDRLLEMYKECSKNEEDN